MLEQDIVVQVNQSRCDRDGDSAQYEGGLPYTGANTGSDPEKYGRRIDEICGAR